MKDHGQTAYSPLGTRSVYRRGCVCRRRKKSDEGRVDCVFALGTTLNDSRQRVNSFSRGNSRRSFRQSAYLWIQGAGARYLHVSDLRAVLEEAGHVVERREDHDEDDEVSGANVEPVNGLNMY